MAARGAQLVVHVSDDALAKARATESMAEEQSYKYGSAASPPPVRAADVAVQKRRKELSEHEAAAVRKRCAEAASAFDRALAAALVEQGVAEDLIADWSAISGTAAEAAAAKAAAEEKAAAAEAAAAEAAGEAAAPPAMVVEAADWRDFGESAAASLSWLRARLDEE